MGVRGGGVLYIFKCVTPVQCFIGCVSIATALRYLRRVSDREDTGSDTGPVRVSVLRSH